MNNIIEFDTKLVGEISGKFLVPSYQRGYRWGYHEVTRLLDDIYQNGRKSYCLQPVVVRKRKDNSYELIDGQQRITTLYLIYKYMHEINSFFNPPAFSLTYETRCKNAGDFLNNIDGTKCRDDINFWFITRAYKIIESWFKQDMQIKTVKMFEYMKEYVKILWYQVGEDEDAASLFTRLNIGRIPLTDSELVKAMFLNAQNNSNEDKREEIALQWDNMERELHNESFWYFLTNKQSTQYPTRIDIILDLITRKKESEREKYYTFFIINAMRDKLTLSDIWFKIQHTFLILKDWFENHELYHKIGYLIASGSKTLQEIFDASQDKTKEEFKAKLDDFIRSSIKINDSNYSDLNYGTRDDNEKISRLLLLFNVESVRQNGESTQWFPFDKFKFTKSAWSLEHIHARKSEGMKTMKAWQEWLRLHINSVRAIAGSETELIAEMEQAAENKNLSGDKFQQLQEKVLDLLSDSKINIDSISNLALINSGDNAALSNSTFDVKRNEIIKRDKNGQYIPFCTRMVFLKYYTTSGENQLHFWGEPDRKAYIENINRVLKNYLEKAINYELEAD